MNLLYLTFLEDSELYLGVKKKINGQTRAFEQLGFSVTTSMWKHDKFYFYGQNNATYNISQGSRLMRQFCGFAKHYILRYRPEIIYFRIDRLSSQIMKVLKLAKSLKTKVILEIPNYPYAGDYLKGFKRVAGIKNKTICLLKSAVCILDDRISGLFLSGKAEAAVLFGNSSDKFFSIPAKNFDNGITADNFEPSKIDPNDKHIRFISVAGTIWWQGYERILKGISEFRKTNPESDYSFSFTLVGGDPREMPEFRNTIQSLGISDCVECAGFKSGDELNKCYASANIGVSTLGCYKRGLSCCSSLKSREYMALGLPFVYAYEDPAIEGASFAKKYPNDDSVIGMESIIEFYKRAAQKNVIEEERRLALEHFDWKQIMKSVLDFSNIEQGDKKDA